MIRRNRGLSAILLHGLLLSVMWPQSPAQDAPADWTIVTGRVIDFKGQPVAGAKVSVFPLDLAVSGGMPRRPITDSGGRYRLSTPAFPGRTRLSAVKETAGYPDTQGLLFSSQNDNMPEVSLAPGALLENVDIRLGPPDSVLDGSVVDARTGNAVPEARITLHRNEPDSMYSATLPSDGHFSFALPPVPIQVAVDAPGYQHWSYKDPADSAPSLLLSGPDHKKIVVELTPQAGAPQ